VLPPLSALNLCAIHLPLLKVSLDYKVTYNCHSTEMVWLSSEPMKIEMKDDLAFRRPAGAARTPPLTPREDVGKVKFVSSSKTLTGAPSLREAHKKRTRDTLREMALKLFATRGYDTTTTEEIAKKADVSARTFFRYFPTKESVLFLGQRAWIESFAEIYRGQPDSLSDVEAMRFTFIELAPGLVRRRQWLPLYKRAVASSPTLRGREQDHREEDVDKVAEAIAARRSLTRADEASTLLAAVGVLTYLRALDAWLAGPASASLGEIIAEEFRLLAELFTQGRVKPKRRPAASQQHRSPSRVWDRPSLNDEG